MRTSGSKLRTPDTSSRPANPTLSFPSGESLGVMNTSIRKSILSVPYNRDLNAFAFPLGPYTYLSDEEDTVSIFTCLPGYIDPDTSNDWYKTLEEWAE